jgi:hypothetical protein
MTDEKKSVALPYIGVGAISVALGLLAGVGIATSKECKECPGPYTERVKTPASDETPSAPSIESSTLKDQPPGPLVPASETPEGGWQAVTSEEALAGLAGDWGDPQHKPVPIVSLQYKMEGSKTPFNIRWHISASNSGGCGFCIKGTEGCEQGIAHCQFHDEDNRRVPMKVKSTATFETQGGLMRITVKDVTQLVVVKRGGR